MPRITESATLGLDPETLWNEIGAFGSVGDWHPMLISVEVFGEGAGALRIARGEAGAAQAERLQTLDSARHLYRYSMEKTSMPVRDYRGEFRIDPAGDAASTVVWSAQFELTPDGDGRTVESVRQFLHAGTESLRRRFGESGA
ncbi:MAG TPA: SRPBCC family protein [Steroidobacteraceae bacterium]|nr:SRPBCC family protein [Steroidobacteraceae bacterium]